MLSKYLEIFSSVVGPRNVSQSLEGMSDLNLTLEARPLGY